MGNPSRTARAPGARPLAVMLVAVVLASACGSAPPAPSSPGSASLSAVVTPGPTAGSCAGAGLQLVTAFVGRLAGELVPLRSLALAADLDASAVATTMRRISEVLTAFDNLDETLAGCAATADLGARIANLRARIDAVLGPVLQGSIKDVAVQRRGAVRMLGLVPDLSAFTDAGSDLARTLGLEALLPADDPLGPLRPLVAGLSAPPPAGTSVVEFTGWADALWPVVDPLATSLRKAGAASDRRARRSVGRSLRATVTDATAWVAARQPWPCYASTWQATADALDAYAAAATAYVDGKVAEGADGLTRARALEATARGIAADVMLARCQLEPSTPR